MNPFQFCFDRYFGHTGSTGSDNSAALYTILRLMADNEDYSAGYVAGSNPFRYVRDAILAYSGRNPFGNWVAGHLNADIEAFDAGR